MEELYTIKLDTEFVIDLKQFDFDGSETDVQIRRTLLHHYFDECGFEGIEIKIKDKPISLFHQIGEIVQKRNEEFYQLEKTV